MAEIVNLHRVRQAEQRRQKAADAAANRLLYGASKAERRLTQARAVKSDQALNGARLTNTEPAEPPPARLNSPARGKPPD